MRLLLILLSLHLLNSQNIMAQRAPQAYKLFSESGGRGKYKKLLKQAKQADVIVWGEAHNDALGHWLQYELLRDLKELDGRPLQLGLEMFEADQQAALQDYLNGKINVAELDKVGEGVWPNFATDYEPIIRWAHANGITVTGTNVPRKYARVVFKEGFEGLASEGDAAGVLYAPTPIPYDPELKAYKEMLEMMGGGHGGANFPKAQAIKDATMAHRIITAMAPNARLLHLNGSFHSDFNQGIVWYLNTYRPELNVMTVTVVEQQNIDELAEENEGRADFIFAVPANMTKTYVGG